MLRQASPLPLPPRPRPAVVYLIVSSKNAFVLPKKIRSEHLRVVLAKNRKNFRFLTGNNPRSSSNDAVEPMNALTGMVVCCNYVYCPPAPCGLPGGFVEKPFRFTKNENNDPKTSAWLWRKIERSLGVFIKIISRRSSSREQQRRR